MRFNLFLQFSFSSLPIHDSFYSVLFMRKNYANNTSENINFELIISL